MRTSISMLQPKDQPEFGKLALSFPTHSMIETYGVRRLGTGAVTPEVISYIVNVTENALQGSENALRKSGLFKSVSNLGANVSRDTPAVQDYELLLKVEYISVGQSKETFTYLPTGQIIEVPLYTPTGSFINYNQIINHYESTLRGIKRNASSSNQNSLGNSVSIGEIDAIGRESVKNCWAVVVGVSQYESSGKGGLPNLSFAKQDAIDFSNSLRQSGWDADHIRALTDTDATQRNIGYALETWLRHAGPDDLIVLYWSSHAWPDPGDPTKAYFACYDSKPSDPSSGWRMDQVRQVLEERGAKNVILVADTCHSGKIIRAGDPKAIGVVPALETMRQQQQIPKGWVFIASADPDRKAYEDKAWSNGALTHVLKEGLAGKADGYQSLGAKDGIVTLGELRGYITDRMAEESLNVLGARLTPLFYTTSGDPDIWNLTLQAGH